MLSYMVPSIQEKPPPVPVPTNKRYPGLTCGHAVVNGDHDHDHEHDHSDMLVTTSSVAGGAGSGPGGVVKSSTISTESSASSLSSGVPDLASTHQHLDKPKIKLLSNGATKHQTLKRVSFGSSKGSMVETLIYESPVQEEPEALTPEPPSTSSSADPMSEIKHPSKVRVTFFEQDKPLVVSSPEPDLADDLDAPFVLSMTSPSPVADHVTAYNRQASTDSGWDNPFRPDGDLSREADEIVELIKGGKPITPTPGSAAPAPHSPPANGSAAPAPAAATPAAVKPASPPGAVELQRATVAPNDASQVEHVTLKKKPKCKCCVIQ